MPELPKIVLKSGKDQSVRRYHPWVFSGAIKKIYGDVTEGDWVEVFDNKDTFLGSGHYQKSSIAVRILSFEQVETLSSLYKSRIKAAFDLRKQTGLTENDKTNVYRLVNAEGDNLPGLIIDYYGGDIVIQMHSAGMYRDIEHITKAVSSLELSFRRFYDKSSKTLPFKSGLDTEDGFLIGAKGDTETIVNEYGYKFKLNFATGQKTGFFIDQRESRKLVGDYSNGRKVLNMFSYSGGFSVYALGNKAKLVHTVDASARAIDLARENIKLNFSKISNHEAFVADAFEYFNESKELYDLIILDPPAFAKHQSALSNALQGYKKINRKAIEVIQPGGLLFTYSCSQAVSKENFRKSVFTAAANTGRNVRIIHQTGHAPDHPVSIYHPEGEYLKGLVLKID